MIRVTRSSSPEVDAMRKRYSSHSAFLAQEPGALRTTTESSAMAMRESPVSASGVVVCSDGNALDRTDGPEHPSMNAMERSRQTSIACDFMSPPSGGLQDARRMDWARVPIAYGLITSRSAGVLRGKGSLSP